LTVVFTTVESLIHYEDGLGFHGWHCIAGPVHQNAAPIMIALSLMAAAVVTAVDAVLAPPAVWSRAALQAARARPAQPGSIPARPRSAAAPCTRSRPRAALPCRPDHGHAGWLRPALVGGIA
jgi:hypothetical protein